MKRVKFFAYILLTLSALTSCDGYDKLLKGSDYEAKYQAAVNYYNDKSYGKAKSLFENMILYARGKEHAEDVAWYYGQCLLKTGEYYTAAYQFKTFTRRFPYSDHTEEAAYLAAYCKYIDSPVYSLDQTVTKEAITELEEFAANYPQSVHIPEVNGYLDELREKLMTKSFEIAMGYYTVEAYNAAVVALNQFLIDYPDSPNREEAMYTIIKAGYEYAVNSREDKVKERLQQVVNDFDKFINTFSDSKHTAECQDIYTRSKALLATIEQEQKQ